MRRFPGMRMEIRQTTKEKIMGIFSMILSLLSGVALFLFGMSLMGDGLKMVAGNKLEAFLYRMTNTPLKGVALGTGVTSVIQSSSATTVMVIGFVNSGMMKLKQQEGTPIYPDANSTLRLTYGKIGSYSPKDGVEYSYYTTLKGVMEKEDPDNFEFVVPAKLKELYNNKDFGRYAMKNGEMPICFATATDNTGGNSGSPVFNSKGELIGTGFDRNYEGLTGDIAYNPQLQRAACVDIRYTLFIIDKFAGAKHLIDEMTIVE